ncbi:MAG: DUF1624 domain-containing protein [Asgard group archaeon]|nr:DUF1624 domain-containing protein [Asgard group archaeon]
MELSYSHQKNDFISGAKRFLSLDITRGIAIVLMLVLHIIGDTLDVGTLLSPAVINDIPIVNLLALIILPFFGGLAGLFLLVSAVGNMISFYRELKKGNSVRGIVLKQIISGVALLAFAMIIEGITGYHGLLGEIFKNLNNVSTVFDPNGGWRVITWRWNYFETIHTIAWCLIINGCVQGLLSLKGNWKNTKKMVISYIILAVSVIGLTQLVWYLVELAIPGYPFANYPNGHSITQPWIGTEPFWDIFRAPFITALASPWEPIFPYLAVSFIGSIIGIVLSQPKDEINQKFPRRMFLVGVVMFVGGLVGIVLIILQIMNGTYTAGVDPFDVAIEFYRLIGNHRIWAHDAANVIYGPETVPIPIFSWVAQFLALNGFSVMILMFLFRMIEFRGKGGFFAKRTKVIRRFGTIALTNYNNQWIYHLFFFLISLLLTSEFYKSVLWGGTFLILFLTLVTFIFLLWLWEKIGYIGSLEWTIRSFTNNVVPIRREKINETAHLRAPDQSEIDNLNIKSKNRVWIRFRHWLRKVKLRLQGKAVDNKFKWWQRGQVDAQRTFYKADWVNLEETQSEIIDETPSTKIDTTEKQESKLALILSIVGACSILFILISIVGLVVSINARKNEGKNKMNTAAFALSIIGCVLLLGLIITSFVLPIGTLGIF